MMIIPNVNNTIDNTIYANKTHFGDVFSEVGKYVGNVQAYQRAAIQDAQQAMTKRNSLDTVDVH